MARMRDLDRRPAMLVAALLLVLLLPGPVAADTCACDPIQPYLAVDRFDEVHVTYRHSDRPGVIYATNKTGTWTRKRLTSARDVPYAIAVDARQRGYVVFQREVDDHMRWQLLTNRTGEWVLSRLSIIPADAYRVRIEIAPDRSIHLTFDRDEAVYYATNASGSWVRRRLDSAMGNNARLALDAAGNVHLVYQQCIDDGTDSCLEPGIYYETNSGGAWTTQRVSFDGEDSSQDILVDASGTVHIAFAREYKPQANPDLPLGMFHLTNAGGTWRATRVAPPGRWASIQRSPTTGTIYITYMHVDGNLGIFTAHNASGSWTRSEVITEWAFYPSTGMDSEGRLRLAFMRMAIDPGIYFSIRRTTGWTRFELMD